MKKQFIVESNFEGVETFSESIGDEGEKHWYVQGPFLQADVVNRNRRFYPGSIMEHSVNAYQRDWVDTSRAVGELNHPCFWSNTEILTTLGWKKFIDLDGTEQVYTKNENGALEKQKIDETHVNYFSGNMLRVKGRAIDTVVTPNHRFLVESEKTGKQKYVTAAEIKFDFENENKLKKWFIPKTTKYSFEKDIKTFVLHVPKGYVEWYSSEPIELNFDLFCSFMGYWLSEGHTTKTSNGYQTGISQNTNSVHTPKIRKCLREMVGIRWAETISKDGKSTTWTTSSRHLGEYLSKFGTCYEKRIDKFVLRNIDQKSATHLLESFIEGDGRNSLEKGQCNVFSVSEGLINDLSQVAAVAGYGTSKSVEITEKDYDFAGRIIKAENKSPLHVLQILKTKGIYLDSRYLNISDFFYEGNVYCITNANGNFIAKDNEKTFWSGNSNSQINMSEITHLTQSIMKEGNNYIGKAKILETDRGRHVQALLKGGVRLGVSSRGRGQLKENNKGISVVQENYHIDAIDIVFSPSAPDAFVDGILENDQSMLSTITEDEEFAEYMRDEMRKAKSQNIPKTKNKLLEDFMDRLSKKSFQK